MFDLHVQETMIYTRCSNFNYFLSRTAEMDDHRSSANHYASISETDMMSRDKSKSSNRRKQSVRSEGTSKNLKRGQKVPTARSKENRNNSAGTMKVSVNQAGYHHVEFTK